MALGRDAARGMRGSRGAAMIAYHNDSTLRTSTLARMRAHAAADEIVQGQYWERGKGCLVGCAIHVEPMDGSRHSAFPSTYGIPEVLARLADRIFEGLPASEAKALPVAFFDAIALGADLSLAWPRFAVALLTDAEHGVARLTSEGSQQRAAIEAVSALFARQIAGETVTREEWRAARMASDYASAYAAADAAAYDAAYYAAAAADDTYAAAYAAASDAAYAAYDAAAADAYAADDAYDAYDAYDAAHAARSAHYSWMASALLSALRSCAVPS